MDSAHSSKTQIPFLLNEQCVYIYTIHKSKGFSFGPPLERRPASFNTPYFVYRWFEFESWLPRNSETKEEFPPSRWRQRKGGGGGGAVISRRDNGTPRGEPQCVAGRTQRIREDEKSWGGWLIIDSGVAVASSSPFVECGRETKRRPPRSSSSAACETVRFVLSLRESRG